MDKKLSVRVHGRGYREKLPRREWSQVLGTRSLQYLAREVTLEGFAVFEVGVSPGLGLSFSLKKKE